NLLNDVENAAILEKRSNELTLAGLRKLDALRIQVERLRNGASWWLHFGLYPGNRIIESTRKAYFQRFDHLILNDLNREMTDQLKSATGPYDPVYRTLKTHITISSTKCGVEPALVSEVLRGVRDQIDSSRGSDWRTLSDQQIEFYANELVHGNP